MLQKFRIKGWTLDCPGGGPWLRFPNSVTSPLFSNFWLKINGRIEYKRLSLTHEALTTAQLGYLSAQPDLCSAPSCSCYSFCCHPLDHLHILLLRITNRSFRYAPPHLWNQLPVSFRQQLYKTPSWWYHTYKFTSHLLTTLTLHHTFTVSFQAQKSPFPQIVSTVVC